MTPRYSFPNTGQPTILGRNETPNPLMSLCSDSGRLAGSPALASGSAWQMRVMVKYSQSGGNREHTQRCAPKHQPEVYIRGRSTPRPSMSIRLNIGRLSTLPPRTMFTPRTHEHFADTGAEPIPDVRIGRLVRAGIEMDAHPTAAVRAQRSRKTGPLVCNGGRRRTSARLHVQLIKPLQACLRGRYHMATQKTCPW